MSMLLRKLPLAMALMASASAFAAADMESRVAELERQMSQVRIVTPNGTCGANTALANPILDDCDECCSSWFVEASILSWHPKVGGTEFAYTDQSPKASLKIKGNVKDMDFSWDWGFKALVGYSSEVDGWDVSLRYTWFDSHGSKRTSAGRGDSVISLRSSPNITKGVTGPFVYCKSIKSQFDYTFNSVDLEMGRHFYLSETLSWRPFIGLKAAWIDLEQITRCTGGETVEQGASGLANNTVHIKDISEMFGVGPRIGGLTNWYIGQGYSLFGSFTSAMLYSRFDVNHKERFSGNKNEGRYNLGGDCHFFVPSVEFMLGAQYDRYVNNDRNHIRVRLSFESQYFWRANQMMKINYPAIEGTSANNIERIPSDLSQHGLTLDFRVDF